jgi:hypothetical protein
MENMTDFKFWEDEVRENLGFVHNIMNDLAFKTLGLCLEDIDVIDDFDPSGNSYQCDYERKYRIAENDFAKIDYIVYAYFYLLVYVYHYESAAFGHEFEDFFQRLLILYVVTELGISQESMDMLLHERLNTYMRLAKNQKEFVKCLREQLVIYLERDFLGNPMSEEYPIISFFEDFDLKVKVGQHSSALMNTLEAFIKSTKTSTISDVDHVKCNIQARSVYSIADLTIDDAANSSEKALIVKYQTTLKELKQKKEKLKNAQELYQSMIGDSTPQSFGARKNVQDAISRISNEIVYLENSLSDIRKSPMIQKMIDRINNPDDQNAENEIDPKTSNPQPIQTEEKAQKESLKDRFQGALGFLGIVLYYLIRIFIAILPFVMIDANFIVTLILISVETFIPLTSIVFWIWGFVCAIMGKQDFLAIMYYIVFAVAWLPFYIQIIKSLFRK